MTGIKRIASRNIPGAVGPYSQAVWAGGFCYSSGILPIDISTGMCVPGGVEAEIRKILDHLAVLTEELGGSLGEVVKVTVYMTDLGEFQTMNKVFGEFFAENYPARTTIQVGALAMGACVEIDAVIYAASLGREHN